MSASSVVVSSPLPAYAVSSALQSAIGETVSAAPRPLSPSLRKGKTDATRGQEAHVHLAMESLLQKDSQEGTRIYLRYMGIIKKVQFKGESIADLLDCVRENWRLSVNPVLNIRAKGSEVAHALTSVNDLYTDCIVDILTYSPENSNVVQKSMRRHFSGFSGADRNLILITAKDSELGERIMDKVNYFMKWQQVDTASFTATGADASNVNTNTTQALKWLAEREGAIAFLLVDDVENILSNLSPDISPAVLRVSTGSNPNGMEEHDSVPQIGLIVNGSKISVSSSHMENATHLIGKVATFLSHLHLTPRPIYLVRHGQSEYNLEERIGGNCDLTERGRLFAEKLGQWVRSTTFEKPLVVWTSTLERAKQSIAQIDNSVTKRYLHALDEINAGVMDGMTYEEIETIFPVEAAARKKDKFVYRYPRGESYEDLTQRLEPVLLELERQQGPVLVLAHQAVLRCLYAYFNRLPLEKIPHVVFPSNTVLRFEGQLPDGYESYPLL